MRCTKCNHELDEHGICPNCYHIHDELHVHHRIGFVRLQIHIRMRPAMVKPTSKSLHDTN